LKGDKKMINEIILNDVKYIFKETFDVNILLSYENDKWNEWEIVREFVSNALDSVNNDVSKINIIKSEASYLIQDSGTGYPIFYAKRIGASNKKYNVDAIGQFGEGTKLAILTSVRNKSKVMICSQNWLIIPYSNEVEGQEVLFYDIYESQQFIEGSTVNIERNENIDEIFNNIGEYFLDYNMSTALHGGTKKGIYSHVNEVCKLYNKGVYIKNINALYSYAVSLNEINRDRNLISIEDLAYKIRDLYETVTDIDIIKSIFMATALPYEQKKKLIEFQTTLYTSYPQVWRETFQNIYGLNALIGTNEIASREAESLGYIVVTNLDYNICRILKDAGVKEDINCLADDFEFVWAETLTRDEKDLLSELPKYAKIAGFNNLPETIRVFSEYKNHENVNGLYNSDKQEIYLKRELLGKGLETVLKTYIHEGTHHVTQADDLNRIFADTLCTKLTEMLIRYSTDVGVENSASLSGNILELPDEIKLTAKDLTAHISVIDYNFIISIGKYTIKIKMNDYIQPLMLKRKISVKNGRFIVTVPDLISKLLVLGEDNCCSCLILS
jgi:hypothetical protein